MSSDARALIHTALPNPRRAAPGVAAGVLQALSTVALLACSAYLITRASEQPPVLYLTLAVVGVRAFALSKAVFRYLERLWSHDAVFRQLTDVRESVLRRLIPIAPDGLGRSDRGSVLSALVSDVDDLQDAWLRARLPLYTSLGIGLCSVGFVAIFSPKAALWLAGCLVLCIAVSVLVSARVSARSDVTLSPLRATLNTRLIDFVQNIEVLTAFGAVESARAEVARADAALTTVQRRRAVTEAMVAAVNGAFAGAASISALIVAAPAVPASLSGPLFAVVVLIPIAVFEVVAALPLALSYRRSVRTSAERIAGVAPSDRPREIPAESPIRDSPATQGLDSQISFDTHAAPVKFSPGTTPHIQLSGLSARWPGAAESTLTDVTLQISPGEHIWIDGSSGAGKTMLAHVLVRFVEYAGVFTLDGVEANALDVDVVRAQIGLIEQSPYLFDTTLRQNLLFAKDTASSAELNEALAAVGLREWAEERGGLDVSVGERGSLVSGGQAQRIALARALLRGFPVLVFDEPTANVDAELAGHVLRTLIAAAQAAGRSVVIISHDDVAADLYDRRLRMVDGTVVQVQ